MMKRKTKNQILYTVVALSIPVLLVVFVGGNSPTADAPAAYSQSRLVAQEKNFDFGTIRMDDGKVTHRYELNNSGAEAISIQEVATSCMCTTATLIDPAGNRIGAFGMPGHGGAPSKTDIKVEAGQAISVDAVFDPAAHGPSGVGLADRVIRLKTNSATSPMVELSFRAMVVR